MGLECSEVSLTAFYGAWCASVCMPHTTHTPHSLVCETFAHCQPCIIKPSECFWDKYNNLTGWFSPWQLVNPAITKLNEFFCDSPCYDLIGCANVGLYAALNGSLPSLADWAAKTACFLFLSPPVMCAVALPVIELWKLAIFVFLWWCEMWSELCMWGLVGVHVCERVYG